MAKEIMSLKYSILLTFLQFDLINLLTFGFFLLVFKGLILMFEHIFNNELNLLYMMNSPISIP